MGTCLPGGSVKDETELPQSLFLRIFLWFWMTVIVTSIALILIFMLQRGSIPTRWHDMLNSTARYSGTIAIAEMDRGGIPARVFLYRTAWTGGKSPDMFLR
jgi:hypothetical protein